MCKLTIHALHQYLIIHQVWRAAEDEICSTRLESEQQIKLNLMNNTKLLHSGLIFSHELPVVDKPRHIAKLCCINDKWFWPSPTTDVNMSINIIQVTASFFIIPCLSQRVSDKYLSQNYDTSLGEYPENHQMHSSILRKETSYIQLLWKKKR